MPTYRKSTSMDQQFDRVDDAIIEAAAWRSNPLEKYGVGFLESALVELRRREANILEELERRKALADDAG